jgi:cell division septal protein FtsQ
MARKKQNRIPWPVIKIGAVVLLALGLGCGLYYGASYGLRRSSYFQVKTIHIDPSLNFIDRSGLDRLKGQSIFTVDLARAQQRLGARYPQVAGLKLIRRFPDQITVVAKQRKPVAQARMDGKTVTLDGFGVILSTTTRRDEQLPHIEGFSEKNNRAVLGHPLTGRDFKAAVQVITAFQNNRVLESYRIKSIDVSNTSKIEFIISNGLKVYIDRDELARKMRLLGFVLTKSEINLDEVKYLDLRFKEPVIGKK